MVERVKPQAGAQRGRWLALGAVLACGVAPFIPALSHGYSDFDDYGMLMETAGYQGLELKNLVWMFTTTHMGHYQPLAWLSFAIEYTLFGLNPAVSHGINVLVHAVNAVLVFVLGARLIGAAVPALSPRARMWGGALAAMLFAAHPLRVESVAWVTERRDVLSLCFYLLAVNAYLDVHERGRRGAGIALWVFFALSLLAKAWGMTFFLVLLILDWYPLRRLPGPGVAWLRPPAQRIVLEKAPLAVVGLAWAVIAAMAQSSTPGTTSTLARWGVLDRVCQGVYGVMFYLWKTVWPVDLAALYELPRSLSPTEPRIIAACAVVGVLAAGCVALRRRASGVAAALLAYVVIVSPVLGVFQSGIQLVADRYSYISMIGVAILAGGAAVRWGRAWPVVAALGAVIVGLGALSWRQTGYWHDAETLFARAIAVGQDGPILRASYGRQVSLAGRHEEALGHFERALALDPAYGEAWFAKGNALKELRRVGEAREAYIAARDLMPDSWRADQALGLLLAAEMDDLEGALPHFRSAVAKIEGPQHWSFQPGPYMTLAQALYDLGDVAGARRELEKALKFRETHEMAAAALKQIGERR